MANHKSALKRARQNEIRRVRNQSYKTKVKNAIKDVRSAIGDNTQDKALEKLRVAMAIIQKSVSKGVIPKTRASRKISRLANGVNQITTS